MRDDSLHRPEHRTYPDPDLQDYLHSGPENLNIAAPGFPVDVAAAGGTATGQVTFDFSGSPSTARFTATISYSATNGISGWRLSLLQVFG